MGDVRAREKQYEAGGAEEEPERALDAADTLVANGLEPDVGTAILIGIGLAEPVHDRVHLRLGRRRAHAGSKARDDTPAAQAATPDPRIRRRLAGDRLERHPEIDVRRREVKARAHDADDREWFLVSDRRTADDVAVASVPPLPEAIADRDDRRALVAGAGQSSDERRRAKHGVDGRHADDGADVVDAFGTGDLGSVEGLAAEARESRGLRLPIENVGTRRRIA